MRQARGGDGLAPEALEERLVDREVRVEHLDRDSSGQDLVRGLPHLRHAAGGDEVVEAVTTADESSGVRAERRVLVQVTASRSAVARSPP